MARKIILYQSIVLDICHKRDYDRDSMKGKGANITMEKDMSAGMGIAWIK
ncbi:MAG: hypothetical protein LUE92_17900 [Clostridiales bacterium]|nr:hypothetical protein [Clostridiales bacterium]